MKKIFSFVGVLLSLVPFVAFAQDFLSPVGYWVQKDHDTGKNLSIMHVYETDKDVLNAKIFVPLAQINDGIVKPPITYCKECGSGDAYGHKYSYDNALYQDLEYVWNVKKSKPSKKAGEGPLYTDGAVLNPHDGKTYRVKAQVLDYGKTVYVRAYMFFGIGRTEYWHRITKKDALEVKATCGLTTDKHYPYNNTQNQLVDKALWYKCIDYQFNDNPLESGKA